MGASPDAGQRSALACRLPAARRAFLHGTGRHRAGWATRHGLQDHWAGPPWLQAGAGRCRRAAGDPPPGWRPLQGARVVSLACLNGISVSAWAWGSRRRRARHRPRCGASRAGRWVRVVRRGRCKAGEWRQAEVPEAVSSPTRHRCAACMFREAVGSRGVGAWSGGWSGGRLAGRGVTAQPGVRARPTRACRRPLIAYARASLRLSAAPEA